MASGQADPYDDDAGDDSPANDGLSKKGLLNRRSYLKFGAAAVGTVAASSLASQTSAAVDRYGVSFDTVLDAVDDLGMDPTGSSPIDDALDKAYGDGVLIEFPAGEYLIEWTHYFDEGVNRFGMVGTGDSPEAVTFTFPEGDTKAARHRDYNENQFGWVDHPYLEMFMVVEGADHVLANFSVQQDEVTGSRITVTIDDGLHIEDVQFLGFNPTIDHAPGVNIRPNISSRNGTGVVRNFVCTGGGVEDVYPHRKVGTLTGQAHYGELKFEEFHVENMGSHPIYASNSNGCIRVENSVFKNNDNTNIRISGRHPDKQSWVKNCTVVVDIDNAKHLPDGEAYQGARGIRSDYGDDVLIENVDMSILSGPPAAYGIGIQHNQGDAGSDARSTVIRDSRVRCDVDGYIPIEGQPNDGHLEIDTVSVTGSGDYRYDAGIVVRKRPATITNSCVQVDGSGMDGVYLKDVDDCSISDTNINVDGKATVFDNASVTTNNITYSDSCPVPATDTSGSGSPDGGTSGDGSTGLDRTLTVVSEKESLVEYLVEIEGEADAITDGDYPGGDYDDVSTTGGVTTIDGVTSDGRGDSWAFSGRIQTFEVTGQATVYVDGTQTPIADVALEPEEQLSIDSGEDGLIEYSFTVDGPVEAVTDGEDPAGDYDDVTTDGSLHTVDGVTSYGRGDTWLFGGEMTEFTATGDGSVALNGTEVEVAALPLGRQLVIDARGTSDTVNYDVTVSGVLAADASEGGSDGSDNVSGSGVEGAVSDAVDAYQFSGDITAITVDGDATVYVDDEVLDPSSIGPTLDHELKVVADSETVTDYTFTVEGSVEPITDGEFAGGDWDDVTTDGDLTTVDGVTSNTGGDRWKFGGRIVDFTLEADGSVYLDGTQVDPAKLGTSDAAAFPHSIVFDGTETAGSCDYRFSVSGSVAKSPDLGTIEAGDDIEDGDITGSVTDDLDGFRFSGHLTGLDLDGAADLEFE